MNVYDFDDTIYDGDSTRDFYLFCLARRPAMLLCLPRQGVAALRWATKRIEKTQFKEIFYSCFTRAGDVHALVRRFWAANRHKVFKWYLAQKRPDDIIISASPEFLLAPVCRELGVGRLIASRVEVPSGKYTGQNCYGEEKVHRFLAEYSAEDVEEFYSDSLSDSPMARLAQKAFLVNKDVRTPWPPFSG